MKTTEEKNLKNSAKRSSLSKLKVNTNSNHLRVSPLKSIRPSKSMVRIQSLKPNKLGLAIKSVEK